jgi:hypothetical protein
MNYQLPQQNVPHGHRAHRQGMDQIMYAKCSKSHLATNDELYIVT